MPWNGQSFTPDLRCEHGHAAGSLDWRCNICAAPIQITNLPHFRADAVRQEDWSLWRYAPMLPAAPILTLGEGLTPLVPVKLADGTILAKLEYLNPTGSYKDRGTAVLVNHLLAQRVGDVVEDSSGNAGASLAMYAGAGGIRARVFVPKDAPPNKKRLIALNAQLVEVDGSRSAPTEACHAAARTAVYASHAWSPFFIAGQMTCAWEIWEQMGHAAPDAIICPVGHGGLFLGLARGFKALLDAGLIAALPRLYAVQAAASDPVVRAWESGAEFITPGDEKPTAADGIVVREPVHGREILRALRETGGMAIRVDETAIFAARDTLLKRGHLVEPTSAVPLAALPTVRDHLGNRGGERIVIPLTGTGLKTLK